MKYCCNAALQPIRALTHALTPKNNTLFVCVLYFTPCPGPVGVEIAAEIITAYPDKSVTIVTSKPTLLNKRYGGYAVKACHEFFAQRGVELVLCDFAEIVRYFTLWKIRFDSILRFGCCRRIVASQPIFNALCTLVVLCLLGFVDVFVCFVCFCVFVFCVLFFIWRRDQQQDGSVLTKTGRLFAADQYMVLNCVRGKPRTSFLEKHFAFWLDSGRYINVNEFFQVGAMTRIFAAGDITSLKEEKLAERVR